MSQRIEASNSNSPHLHEEERLTQQPVKHAPEAINRWWLSLPITTFLVVLFYAQGRAYLEGYLTYFGLDLSLFPVSPEDAYWHAFTAWAMVMGQAPGKLLHQYPSFLLGTAPMLAFYSMLPIGLWIGKRHGWLKKLQGRRAKIRASAKELSPQLVLSIPALFIVALPLIVIVLVIVPAIVTVIGVLPFIDLGRTQAKEDCMASTSNYSIAHYVNEQPAGQTTGREDSARLLQCNTAFCVLIREGATLVIPSTSLRSIDGRGVGRHLSYVPVPEDQRLCWKPPAKTGVKADTLSRTTSAYFDEHDR